MDGQLTWTDCDEAGDYVVPNVLSPRDLVFRPDNMDETVPHTVNLVLLYKSGFKVVTFTQACYPDTLKCLLWYLLRIFSRRSDTNRLQQMSI